MKPAKKLGYMDIKDMSKQVKISKLRNEYGIYRDNNFYGIRYYTLDEDSKQYLLKTIIPDNMRDKFEVLMMMINYHDILPHTDSDVKTVINYYVKTAGAVTHFWKLRDMDNVCCKLQNQTDGSIYNINDLIPNYSFKAKNNELWILNVKEIHSVLAANDTRIAFCFQSELDYIDVLNKINF